MIHQFEKFKIPTLFGLGIILVGIVAGVFLISKESIFLSEASVNLIPRDILISNINDTSATISWQTRNPTYSVVTYSTLLQHFQATDERDLQTPSLYTIHFVKLNNLQPKTIYKFRILQGKIKSDEMTFQTAVTVSKKYDFGPVIGSVSDEGEVLAEGLVYLLIPGSITQAATINSQGNFVIPLNQVFKADLSDVLILSSETIAKITVVSKNKKSQVSLKISPGGTNLPSIILGQDLDLTAPPLEETPSSKDASPSATLTPTESDLEVFDLNGDDSINATDHAILLKNFGKSPQNIKADLNSDGVVDQKDLTLMSEKINLFITK